MADETDTAQAIVMTAPAGKPVKDDTPELPAHPKPTPGWVRHKATDTFHEVDDVDNVLGAYPDEYEAAKAPTNSNKIGWPKAD